MNEVVLLTDLDGDKTLVNLHNVNDISWDPNVKYSTISFANEYTLKVKENPGEIHKQYMGVTDGVSVTMPPRG